MCGRNIAAKVLVVHLSLIPKTPHIGEATPALEQSLKTQMLFLHKCILGGATDPLVSLLVQIKTPMSLELTTSSNLLKQIFELLWHRAMPLYMFALPCYKWIKLRTHHPAQ